MDLTYTGWPVIFKNNDSRMTNIEPVPGRRFNVRAGAFAKVIGAFIRDFHEQVEPIDQGILDDWSWNPRKTTGGSSWSSHAGAVAVDLNAARHPYNTKATSNFTKAQIDTMNRLLDKYSWNGQRLFRWLDGHDPMHVEANYVARGGSPDAFAAYAATMGGATPPAETPQPSPELTPLEPRAIEWANPPADLTRIVQEIVGAGVDGQRGDQTRRLTKAHQRKLGIKDADTMFGPRHALAYLLSVGNLCREKPDEQMPRGAVKLLQWIGGLNPDASFGTGTELAVKRMQKWAGLYPDGNAGDDTKKGIVR